MCTLVRQVATDSAATAKTSTALWQQWQWQCWDNDVHISATGGNRQCCDSAISCHYFHSDVHIAVTLIMHQSLVCPRGGYRAYPRGLTFLHFLKSNFPTLGIEFFVKVPHPRANISISRKLFSTDSATTKKIENNLKIAHTKSTKTYVVHTIYIYNKHQKQCVYLWNHWHEHTKQSFT